MSNNKKVKEVMVDIFKFPHIPYWFTIKQAMVIIKKSFVEGEKLFYPPVVFVFDEKYNLMGSFLPSDIIRGLEPKIMKPKIMLDEVASVDIENAMSTFEANLFSEESKKLAEKPVSEIMVTAKLFVSPDDSIIKAAFLMVHHSKVALPVLENGRKFIGVIRMLDVFNEISNILLES
jgi:CBS domain-containing protein